MKGSGIFRGKPSSYLMGIQERHPPQAAETAVWFHSLVAEASAATAGAGGAGAAWLWRGDQQGSVPCTSWSVPQEPLCSLPGHCKESHLEKLSCTFFILTKYFFSVPAFISGFSVGKNSRERALPLQCNVTQHCQSCWANTAAEVFSLWVRCA